MTKSIKITYTFDVFFDETQDLNEKDIKEEIKAMKEYIHEHVEKLQGQKNYATIITAITTK